MALFKNRPRWLNIVLLLGLFVLLFGNQGFRGILRNRRELKKLNSELAKSKKEEAGLRSELRRLAKDDAYLEKIARRDFGLLKPGEIEYRIKTVIKGDR